MAVVSDLRAQKNHVTSFLAGGLGWQMMNYLLLLVFILPISWGLFQLSFGSWSLRHIPGPRGSFLVGTRGTTTNFMTTLKRFNEYGSCFKVQIGLIGWLRFRTFSVVFVSDPDVVASIAKQPDRGVWNKGFIDGSLPNTFSSDGPKWRQLRHLNNPFFNKNAVRNQIPVILEPIAKLIDFLESSQTGKPIEMDSLLGALALDVLGRVAFGTDFGAIQGGSGGRIVSVVAQRMAQVGELQMNPLKAYSSEFKARRHQLDLEWTKICRTALQDRTPGSYASVLAVAMEQGELTEGEAISEVSVMITAGHETTSHTMAWALYELARPSNAHILAQAQAEADLVCAGARYPPAAEQSLNDLPYISNIVKESARLHHVAASGTITRTLSSPVSVGSLVIPTGTAVSVLSASLHLSEKHFPAPFVFSPERNFSAKTWIPFGAGSRACLGQQLALTEAVLSLAALLHNFEFSLPADFVIEPVWALTYRPRALPMMITPRYQKQ